MCGITGFKKILEKNVDKNFIQEKKLGLGLRENDLMLGVLRKESEHIFSDRKNIINNEFNFKVSKDY